MHTRNTITIDLRSLRAEEEDFPDLLRAECSLNPMRTPVQTAAKPTCTIAQILVLDDCPFTDVDSDRLPTLSAPQIQVLRRSYRSLQEVVSGFDISVCGFAFDGKNVFARDDAREAMSTGVILGTSEQRSFQYEARLLKYAARGWALNIPQLDFKRISPNLEEQGNLISLVCLTICVFLAFTFDKLAGEGSFLSKSQGLLKLVLFHQAIRKLKGNYRACNCSDRDVRAS